MARAGGPERAILQALKVGRLCRGGSHNPQIYTPGLALGLGGFFFLGFFLLLFRFEFVAQEFEDGYLGAVSDAVACQDDAGVAAGAVGELWRDFAEEFLGYLRR